MEANDQYTTLKQNTALQVVFNYAPTNTFKVFGGEKSNDKFTALKTKWHDKLSYDFTALNTMRYCKLSSTKPLITQLNILGARSITLAIL